MLTVPEISKFLKELEDRQPHQPSATRMTFMGVALDELSNGDLIRIIGMLIPHDQGLIDGLIAWDKQEGKIQ